MAKLTAPVQLAIVRALACFDTPSEVAAAVRRDLGVDVTRQQIATYDPTKAAGRNLSAKLRAVFGAARRTFLTDMHEIPISHLSVRLRMLQRELDRAQERGNTAMVLKILEQAAKECGGVFTNRRELTGAGGGPIQSSSVTIYAPPAAAAAQRAIDKAMGRPVDGDELTPEVVSAIVRSVIAEEDRR